MRPEAEASGYLSCGRWKVRGTSGVVCRYDGRVETALVGVVSLMHPHIEQP